MKTFYSRKVKFINSEDTDNTDVLDDLFDNNTIITRGTRLEAYFNLKGVESGLSEGYSRFIIMKEDISFNDLLSNLEKNSGLSYGHNQIQFIGSGNADLDTKFELI